MNLLQIVAWRGQPISDGYVNTDTVAHGQIDLLAINPVFDAAFPATQRPIRSEVEILPTAAPPPFIASFFDIENDFVAVSTQQVVAVLEAPDFAGAPTTTVVTTVGEPLRVIGDLATTVATLEAADTGGGAKLSGQYSSPLTRVGGGNIDAGASVVVNFEADANMDEGWTECAFSLAFNPLGAPPYTEDFEYALPPGTTVSLGATGSLLTWSNSLETGFGNAIPDEWGIANLGISAGGSPGLATFRVTCPVAVPGLAVCAIRQTFNDSVP